MIVPVVAIGLIGCALIAFVLWDEWRHPAWYR
jgi:hypothetical protein